MANNSILIDILSIGRDFLEEKKEINTDELKSELCKKGHSEDDIKNALELFYPENFKNKYNKGSWLSSDGHIRLLQYESLKSSESNLALAKENLDTAKNTFRLAVVTMVASIAIPMIMPLFDKSDKQFQNSTISKQYSIISILQQTVIHQDSTIHSLEKLQQSIINSPSNISKDSVDNKKKQNTITTIPKKK